MRLGLLGSLVIHTGVAGSIWLLSTSQTEARAAVPAAYLDIAPPLLPERPVPPPPEPTAPAAPPEIVPALPAEATAEPLELAEAVSPMPQPFRLLPATKLTTPLPVRRAAPAPPAAAKEKPAPSRGSPTGTLVAPRLRSAPEARYPSRARRLGWEGRVILELRVSARGSVEKVTIATSSGRAVLDRAAADAARRWSFRPATRDGRPIAHTVLVPVEFTLVPP